MSIPISQIIQINPGVIGTGSNPLALNGLILTPSDDAPTNVLKTCYSLSDVSDFFGSESDEYKAAVPYFSGSSVRSALAPNALMFIRYSDVAVSAWAKGSSIAGMTLSELQSVSGSLSVTIDGKVYSSDSLSLSSATSFTDAASIIQTALSLASGQSVSWNSTFSRFEIKSGTSGATSTISAVTGTTAEELGLADATLSQGSEAISPASAIASATSKSMNWATFSILFAGNASSETKSKHNQDLAKWQATQNNRYLFVAWDDNTDAVDPDGTDTFGQWLQTGNYNVLCCYNTPQVATFAQGIAASINWNAVNGRATLAFKTQEGLDATVSSLTEANALLAKGYSYYGAYAADGPANNYNIFYDGSLAGEWQWADSYINQIFLNAQLRIAMIDMLMGCNTLPYNELGKAQIRAAAMAPIEQGLLNGTIRTGINLSQAQKLQVQSIVGFDVSDELYTKGYYLFIGDASTQTRGQRLSPPIYFFYCDGGSIQRITIPSIAIL